MDTTALTSTDLRVGDQLTLRYQDGYGPDNDIRVRVIGDIDPTGFDVEHVDHPGDGTWTVLQAEVDSDRIEVIDLPARLAILAQIRALAAGISDDDLRVAEGHYVAQSAAREGRF